jgi:hypothetical protein
MIAMLTAYTRELEDPRKAASEILAQLDIENRLRKNSAALIFCHSMFIEQGLTQTVCENLPFDTIGCCCQYFALSGAADEILLTVTVLTSDDVEFAAGISGSLSEENLDARIQSLYHETAAALNAEPALVFAALPTMLKLGGDVIAAAVDRACRGIPVFGAAALDMDTKVRHPKTIFKGEAYSDRLILLLFKGPVKPRFFSLTFPGSSVFIQDAVITGVMGNRITTINNIPADSFIREIGLIQANENNGVSALPLVINYNDGTDPCVVVMRGITADGALITSRHLRVGGVLNIGSITANDVLESAKTLLQDIKKTGGGSGLIIFSCFLRNIVLGGNSMAEIDLVQKELGSFPGPYLFLYSGGEFCPKYTESGGTVNRYYQYALVACQF